MKRRTRIRRRLIGPIIASVLFGAIGSLAGNGPVLTASLILFVGGLVAYAALSDYEIEDS